MYKGFCQEGKLNYKSIFGVKEENQRRRKNKLSVIVVSIFVLLIITFVLPFSTLFRTMAATSTWDMTSSGDYSFDSDYIEIDSGEAQLKSAYTPGVDWIAADGEGNGWGHRSKIIIDNTLNANELTDHQVSFILDSQTMINDGKLNSECEDLRFADSNGADELNYWIDSSTCDSDSTQAWINIPIFAASSEHSIYVYYGNDQASDGSDGDNTFDFYDDFIGSSIDLTKWEDAGSIGGCSVSSGELLCIEGSGGDYRWIKTKEYTVPATFFVEFAMRPSWGTSQHDWDAGIDFGSNYIAYKDDTNNGTEAMVIVDNAPWDSRSSGGVVRNYSDNNTYHKYRAERNQTDRRFYDLTDDRSHTRNAVGDVGIGKINFYGDADTSGYGAYYDWIRVRDYVNPEPTTSIGTQEGLLSTSSPTLVPNTGQGFSTLSGFSETLGSGSSGDIKYQISNDDSSTWYWYTGGSWTETLGGYVNTNTASEINTNIADFDDLGSNPKTLVWRAYLNSDGSQQPKLDNIELSYVWDTGDPDNPTSGTTTVLSEEGGDTLTTGTWYNYVAPYISWSAPDDNCNAGETVSGVAGYYVYFGTDNTADPSTAGSYQTGTNYTASSLTSDNTYYLRIETADNAGNVADIMAGDPALFTYQYDGDDPVSPLYVSVSPSGYSRTNSFTFSWPTTGENAASDAGGSDLAGYQYKINSEDWSEIITGGEIEMNDQADQGVNVFYFRAIDNAGGYDQTPVQTNFYFNDTAPTCPTNLSVAPESSEENSFTFSWDEPTGDVEVSGYYYSVNNLPAPSNVSFTEDESIGPGPYATQQGENTFYIVTKDMAGNYDLESCSSITGNPTIDSCARAYFTAETSAPGAPTSVSVVDGSNREQQLYKVFLSWTAPANQGTGFNGYEVYRSSDGESFSSVGTTSGTTYADTNLSSTLYYYNVKSKDNAGQYSVVSSTVEVTPTGRYTSPPELVLEPSDTATTYTASVSWETDRESSSFIDYGTEVEHIGNLSGGDSKGQLDSVTHHIVNLSGLEAETVYYYKAVWVDSDGNRGQSNTYSFTTDPAPKVSEVDSAQNIRLDSMLINWKTSSIANCSIYYGKTSAYGGISAEAESSFASSHITTLEALEDSAEYHFQIRCRDSNSNLFTSDDYIQTTLTRPKVSNLRFESAKDAPTTTLKFTWETNTPTTSIVTYQGQGQTLKTQSNADYELNHEIVVENLNDRTTYLLQAKGVDEYGNEAISDINTFTTPDDTRPPKVSDLTVEIKSSGFGQTQKSQIVVSWQTDEPASSQIEYDQGISGTEYNFKTKEDSTLSTSHAVIVNELDPANIYHLRAASKDSSGNVGYSQDTTTITGKSQDSIVDIILNSLEKSLGWMFNVFSF